MDKVRTFVAITLPADVREELADLRNRLDSPGLAAKWVSRENIHLTLKFLGSVDADRLVEIEEALKRAVQEHSSFRLVLGGVGSFPSPLRPRVIWAGVVEGREELRAIARAVEDELAHIGFPKERKGFSAHVTLARVKREKKRGELAEAMSETDYRSRSIEVSRVEMMRSQLRPQGPIYTLLAEVTLG